MVKQKDGWRKQQKLGIRYMLVPGPVGSAGLSERALSQTLNPIEEATRGATLLLSQSNGQGPLIPSVAPTTTHADVTLRLGSMQTPGGTVYPSPGFDETPGLRGYLGTLSPGNDNDGGAFEVVAAEYSGEEFASDSSDSERDQQGGETPFKPSLTIETDNDDLENGGDDEVSLGNTPVVKRHDSGSWSPTQFYTPLQLPPGELPGRLDEDSMANNFGNGV